MSTSSLQAGCRQRSTICWAKRLSKTLFLEGLRSYYFSLGLSDRSHLQVQATEPSTAIRLTLSNLLQLTAKHADFQLAMFRLAANIFKQHVMVDRSLPKPSVVGIVHHSEASRPLAGRLARRLRDLGESPCIVGHKRGPVARGPFCAGYSDYLPKRRCGYQVSCRDVVKSLWRPGARTGTDQRSYCARALSSRLGLTRRTALAATRFWVVPPGT
jgi:hypothetical protein